MTPEDAALVRRLRGSRDPDLIMPCDEAAVAIERLSAENDENIERWQLYESLCDEIVAEKEAAEAETAEFVALTVTLTGRLERCKAEKDAADADADRLAAALGPLHSIPVNHACNSASGGTCPRCALAAHAARRGQS